MKWSLQLGRLVGIPVQVHWTFILILIWVGAVYYRQGGTPIDIGWGILFVLAIFICVVLHELGHALMGRRFGVKTKSITLLPIGGVAHLDHIPEEPKSELLIAVAGPLVNIIIAAVLFIGLGMTGQLVIPDEPSLFITPQYFLLNLMSVNLFLVVFNAIPAFPMDGGRVLRAVLSFQMDRVSATRAASSMGQLIAILFAVAGIFYNPFLIVIALFVYLGAQGEAQYVQMQSSLEGYTVKDIIMKQFATLPPDSTLQEAARQILDSQETGFLVMDNDQVQGTLTRNQLLQALSDHDNTTPVNKVMTKQFPSLTPEQPLAQVYRQMQEKGHYFLPVLDNDRLVGVLDLENINEHIQIQDALRKQALKV